MIPLILLSFSLPFLTLAADPQPAAVTPCTVGIDTPCLPSSTCTPTMISTSGKPWLGQCIATPTPPPTKTPECHVGWANGECGAASTCTPTETCYRLRPCGGKCIATPTPPPTLTPSAPECHVGWESQCNTGSTCTPTETCYRLRPCGGKCIATPTPQPTTSSPPIITDYPPTTRTECHVGWDNGECRPGSTCTPTMTCQKGRPCGGACIATPTPPPASTQCHVGWDNGECGYGSTCTPTMTCQKGRPCGGACIATPTPLPTTSSAPPVITDYLPTTKTECHVGWDNSECRTGSTCTPTMTCLRGRPCGGACIATPTPPASTGCKAY